MNERINLRAGREINILHYPGPADQPTLFLIHGLGGRSQQWREQIKALQNKFRLIIPDLFGHGSSDKPNPKRNNPYSFEELKNDVQAIFERYAGESNVILGHSYGGTFATFLAAQNPKRIKKLVLLSPLACRPRKESPIFFIFPAEVLELFRSAFDKIFDKIAFDPSTSKALIEEERDARKGNPMYLIKGLLIGLKEIPELDLSQIDIPTLIICGRSDKLLPAVETKKFFSGLRNQRFEVLELASHMALVEQAPAVNKLIAEFLAN